MKYLLSTDVLNTLRDYWLQENYLKQNRWSWRKMPPPWSWSQYWSCSWSWSWSRLALFSLTFTTLWDTTMSPDHLVTLDPGICLKVVRLNFFFSFFICVKLFWSYIALPANFTLWLRSLFSQFLLLLWFPHSLSIQCQIKSGPDQNRLLQSSPSSMTQPLTMEITSSMLVIATVGTSHCSLSVIRHLFPVWVLKSRPATSDQMQSHIVVLKLCLKAFAQKDAKSYWLHFYDFYRTQVRSLARLPLSVKNWLIQSLLLRRLDWCDSGLWRCQLKTSWCR